MGTIRHHAIVVTSYNKDSLAEARAQADILFGSAQANALTGSHLASISEITKATANSYGSFLIAPDGSNEWWDHSDLADAARREYITYLNGTRNGDPSLSGDLGWVEAQYGGPGNDDMVLCSVDKDVQVLYAAVARIAHEGHARREYPSYAFPTAPFDVLSAMETIGLVFEDNKRNFLLTGSGFQSAEYVGRSYPMLVKAVTHNAVNATV